MDNKSSFSVYPLLLNKNTDASDVMWVAICMQLLDSDLDIRKDMFDIVPIKHPSTVSDILMQAHFTPTSQAVLPVTQYYFDQRDIKNEKTCFNPFPSKAEVEQQRNFANL